ncbi:MAG: hypothetical protein Tsb0014_19330 [Pleurocapsa sp.]
MNNWWKNITLIFSIIFVACTTQSFNAIAARSRVSKTQNYHQFLTRINTVQPNTRVHDWLLAQNQQTCQDLQPDYQKVYDFETQNFYINICQVNGNFFYYRQSKIDANDLIFIPAIKVFGGDVFQAVDGKVTYFVGIDEYGYYSSVMYNSNEIVFEPELPKKTTELAENARGLPKSTNQNINVNSAEIEENLDSSRTLNSQAKICTQDKTDIDPYFNGWQEFIGESPQVIGKYATSKGHDFVYSNNTPSHAFIETADGLIVDLNIATLSETIERVCVNPVAEN